MLQDEPEITSDRSEIKSGGPDHILASLFRTILFEMGITTTRFNTLLERYVTRARIPRNSKDISSARGNIVKALNKPFMSWKTFIKGMVLVNAKKLTIVLHVEHASGKVTIHKKIVDMETAGNIDSFDETD